MKTFEFTQGEIPILVSMPHNGTLIPQPIASNMTESALRVVDTDWYLDRLYQFAAELGCSIIKPLYSRYVVDLNRPKDNHSLYPGADTTELCPTTQFDHKPIYLHGKEPDPAEISSRVEQFWSPYHYQLQQAIEQIQSQFGYVLLFEAHSIRSMVPRFFEGKLSDFNFGNYDKKSSCTELSDLINDWQPSQYSKVFNMRFKGGYITRHYANPQENIDCLQLELSQATYMDEESLQFNASKAALVVKELHLLFISLRDFCCQRSNRS